MREANTLNLPTLVAPDEPAIKGTGAAQAPAKGSDSQGPTMSENGELIIYPMPSLVATLLNRERAKGSPLTEEEVIQIRDSCPAIALTREDARRMDESRGYLDIDPENCWVEWQRVRLELADD
ncbi:MULTISPECIES: hypothetical protein [unclassified Mesorhizobium]|uniref:hypothetical protein n=1 Tax=unclassified Mesorhizobium TaxID=325217 RepID=UPI0018D360B7|nr:MULTISPECIES: hypothetical protein [unclassified Mesorhizobium]